MAHDVVGVVDDEPAEQDGAHDRDHNPAVAGPEAGRRDLNGEGHLGRDLGGALSGAAIPDLVEGQLQVEGVGATGRAARR